MKRVTAAFMDVVHCRGNTSLIIGGLWRLNLTVGSHRYAGFEFTRIMCSISKMWFQMCFVFVCSQFHHSVVIHSDILNML